jgi:hypothetical protein
MEERTGEGRAWLKSLRSKMILRETGFGGKKWRELGKGRAQGLASVLELRFICSN